MALGSAPTPWRKGKGALAAFLCQGRVEYSHFPEAQHPFLQASWRMGDNSSPQGTKKIAPLLGLLRRTQNFLFCKSQKFNRLAQSKVGCSAPSGRSTITMFYHSLQGLAVFRACLFLGEYPPGNYFIEDLLPLGFVCIPPSQPSESNLQKGLWTARSFVLFFVISAVHESFPYKTCGKLFPAEQSEWRKISQLVFRVLEIVDFYLCF